MVTGIDIAKPFCKATQEILAVMAGLQTTVGKPYVKKDNLAKGDISAIIGVTGDKKGTIAVSFPQDCAVALVHGMLGDDVENLEHDVQDAVGEVANMISGQARAGLAAIGITLQGSTPSIVIGTNHTIRHFSTASVIAIPFQTQAGEFTVEFCLE